MNRTRLLLVIAAAVLMAGWSPSSARAAVHCGDTITTSVTLYDNLLCSTSALLVTGNNVIVNLNGHSITGLSGAQTGIFVGAQNVLVENGTVTGFQFGADVQGSGSGESATFLHMTFSHNGTGVNGFEASVAIRASSVVENSGTGVNVVSGPVLIRESRVSANGGIGVLSANNGGSITNSYITDNHGLAVEILNNGFTLIGDHIGGGNVTIDSPYCCPPDAVYVANSTLINSQVLPSDQAIVIDGGGNRGNNCGPYLACAPLP